MFYETCVRPCHIDPAKIVSLKAVGAVESTTSGGTKKFTVKQGEPIQLICKVDGNPEPKVQWVKRVSIWCCCGSSFNDPTNCMLAFAFDLSRRWATSKRLLTRNPKAKIRWLYSNCPRPSCPTRTSIESNPPSGPTTLVTTSAWRKTNKEQNRRPSVRTWSW